MLTRGLLTLALMCLTVFPWPDPAHAFPDTGVLANFNSCSDTTSPPTGFTNAVIYVGGINVDCEDSAVVGRPTVERATPTGMPKHSMQTVKPLPPMLMSLTRTTWKCSADWRTSATARPMGTRSMLPMVMQQKSRFSAWIGGRQVWD